MAAVTSKSEKNSAKPDVSDIIRKTGEDWAAAWNARDLDKLVAAYADDAVYLPPHHTAVHGKAAIREYLKQPLGHGGRLQFEVTYIKHKGDLAYDVGRYTMEMPQANGSPRHDEGKYLCVWRRDPDGTWRLVADMWSSDLPA